MKNGKCPKCGSATVHSKTNGIGENGAGQYIDTSAATRRSPVVAFVCIACGYFEYYIADPQKLADVAKNWSKVSVGK